MIRVFSGVPEGFRTPPGEVMGLIGPYGKERSRPQGLLRPSPCWSELDKGLGGRNTPFSFSLSLPSFPLPRGNPTRTWSPSRTPLSLPWPALHPLYTEGGGASSTQVDSPSRVRRPPPPFRASVIFSESLGEALPESLHHHRRHAVVLTELIYFLDILLDQEGEGRHRAVRV